MVAKLKLKPEITKRAEDAEAVRELMTRCLCLGGSTLDLDYAPKPKPKLKLRLKPLGGSDTTTTPNARIERYISESVSELLSRTVV